MNNIKNEVRKIVMNYLAEELEIDAQIINLNDSFEKFDEYGLNSIYFVKIIIEFEKIFDINFEDDYLVLENYTCIQDLVDYISKKLDNNMDA